MKNYSFLIIVLSVFCLFAFSAPIISLEKTWVFESYNSNNQTTTYKQRAKFHREKFGIQFLPEGKIKIKQNINWCGTISLGEKINWEIVDGNWSISKDSVIVINHLLWGKNYTQKLKIIKLTKDELVVKNVNQDTN